MNNHSCSIVLRSDTPHSALHRPHGPLRDRALPCTPALLSSPRSRRPRPLKVVFGAPVAPRAGERPEELAARYAAALDALAAEQGVELLVVE